MRYLAMLVALLWASWWLYWGGLSVMLLPDLGTGGVAIRIIPGVLFLLATLSAWRNEDLCGFLLVGAGLAILIGFPTAMPHWYPSNATVFVMAAGGIPPACAGALFLLERRKRLRAELEELEG
jgi:hypothetical protein